MIISGRIATVFPPGGARYVKFRGWYAAKQQYFTI